MKKLFRQLQTDLTICDKTVCSLASKLMTTADSVDSGSSYCRPRTSITKTQPRTGTRHGRRRSACVSSMMDLGSRTKRRYWNNADQPGIFDYSRLHPQADSQKWHPALPEAKISERARACSGDTRSGRGTPPRDHGH